MLTSLNLTDQQVVTMKKIGLSVDPEPLILKDCNIRKSMLVLNLHRLLSALSITLHFQYAEHFDLEKGDYVIDDSKIFLSKKGELLAKPEFEKIVFKAFAKLTKRFWESTDLYQIEEGGRHFALCEVVVSRSKTKVMPLWLSASPLEVTDKNLTRLHWFQELLGPVLWQFNVKPVDSIWLIREIYSRHYSFTDGA